MENLHLKDKYGRKNYSTNPIAHDSSPAASYAAQVAQMSK